MKKEPKKVIGFFTFWFGFAMGVVFIIVQIYMRMYYPGLTSLAIAGFTVMLNGLYMMSGSKLTLSYEFWKEKFGGGYPLLFGAVLQFYIEIITWIILCIFLVIFVAPSVVHRLFILLIGTTVTCLLFYFRFRDRRVLE